MGIHNQNPNDTIIKTTVRTRIFVEIEINVRVPPDGREPTLNDFEWGQIVEVDDHWVHDEYTPKDVIEACQEAIAAHKQKGTV